MRRFELPWPPDPLWPNKRAHWAPKAKATKAYRFAAKALANGATVDVIRVTFCPKPKGPVPDMDNAIAAFKAGQDGIADGLGVNDRDLRVSYAFGERAKNGGVIVEIGLPKSEPMP